MRRLYKSDAVGTFEGKSVFTVLCLIILCMTLATANIVPSYGAVKIKDGEYAVERDWCKPGEEKKMIESYLIPEEGGGEENV